MTVNYFAPHFRTMIAAHVAQRQGLEAWRHVVSVFQAHETMDCRRVRGFHFLKLSSYGPELGVTLAEIGKNSAQAIGYRLQ